MAVRDGRTQAVASEVLDGDAHGLDLCGTGRHLAVSYPDDDAIVVLGPSSAVRFEGLRAPREISCVGDAILHVGDGGVYRVAAVDGGPLFDPFLSFRGGSAAEVRSEYIGPDSEEFRARYQLRSGDGPVTGRVEDVPGSLFESLADPPWDAADLEVVAVSDSSGESGGNSWLLLAVAVVVIAVGAGVAWWRWRASNNTDATSEQDAVKLESSIATRSTRSRAATATGRGPTRAPTATRPRPPTDVGDPDAPVLSWPADEHRPVAPPGGNAPSSERVSARGSVLTPVESLLPGEDLRWPGEDTGDATEPVVAAELRWPDEPWQPQEASSETPARRIRVRFRFAEAPSDSE